MANTPESKRIIEYQKENLEQITFRALKRWHLREAIAQAAQDRGTNSRQYILNAIIKELKKDGRLPEEMDGEEGE